MPLSLFCLFFIHEHILIIYYSPWFGEKNSIRQNETEIDIFFISYDIHNISYFL